MCVDAVCVPRARASGVARGRRGCCACVNGAIDRRAAAVRPTSGVARSMVRVARLLASVVRLPASVVRTPGRIARAMRGDTRPLKSALRAPAPVVRVPALVVRVPASVVRVQRLDRRLTQPVSQPMRRIARPRRPTLRLQLRVHHERSASVSRSRLEVRARRLVKRRYRCHGRVSVTIVRPRPCVMRALPGVGRRRGAGMRVRRAISRTPS